MREMLILHITERERSSYEMICILWVELYPHTFEFYPVVHIHCH